MKDVKIRKSLDDILGSFWPYTKTYIHSILLCEGGTLKTWKNAALVVFSLSYIRIWGKVLIKRL